jgi:hypothetical protein
MIFSLQDTPLSEVSAFFHGSYYSCTARLFGWLDLATLGLTSCSPSLLQLWIRECMAKPYGKLICQSPLRHLERGIECPRSVFSYVVSKSFPIGRFLDWLCRRLHNSSARMTVPSPLMASQDRV